MDEVREFILTMPFAIAQKLEIEHAADGVGIASMPLSDVVAFNDTAFQGMAIGIVADVAAGAATLAMTTADQFPLTGSVDTTITASTEGSRLTARAELRERDDTALVFDAIATVEAADGSHRPCGSAVVTMRIARPRR